MDSRALFIKRQGRCRNVADKPAYSSDTPTGHCRVRARDAVEYSINALALNKRQPMRWLCASLRHLFAGCRGPQLKPGLAIDGDVQGVGDTADAIEVVGAENRQNARGMG